jgi:hypothetical protein
MTINHKKRSRQKGNAGIELGIIDFSVAIFVMDTVEFAARQGVRYAITGNTANDDSTGAALKQDASIRQVVRDNSLGFLSSVPDSQITIDYFALDPSTNTWTSTTSNANGNLVKVGVSGFSWAWMVPGWRGMDSLSINAASADITGACVNGICPPRS